MDWDEGGELQRARVHPSRQWRLSLTWSEQQRQMFGPPRLEWALEEELIVGQAVRQTKHMRMDSFEKLPL